jgi:HD-GYP domain-containing protein (c-di-GMP phosphodiesterase class II)
MSYIEIPIDKLKIGMSVRIDLSWWRHPFLQNSFRVKSQGDIEELKKCGIKKILFDPEQSKTEEDIPPKKPSPSSPPSPASEFSKAKETNENKEVRAVPRKYQNQFMKEWQKKFLQKEREYGQAYGQVSHIMNNLEADKKKSMQWAHELLQNVADAFFLEADPIVYLINIKDKDEIAYFHSLNTSILSMLLGKALGLLRMELKELGMGALFHDVGKLRIPK